MKSVPRRVVIQSVVEGRYHPGERPMKWENRRDGVDRVRTTEGEEIFLSSVGQQSTPAPGWELLLTGIEDRESHPCFSWTLYGIKQHALS